MAPWAVEGTPTDDAQDWFILEEMAAKKAAGPRPSDRPREIVKRSLLEYLPFYPAVARTVLRPMLVDARNETFVLYTLLMAATVLPSAAWLFASFAWWHGAVHVVLVTQLAATYVAILHNSCHRATYAKPFAYMEYLIPYVLAPFMGQTWNTYYYHHVKHHHVEDNGPNDLSSTLRYRRDSFADFVVYFLRFLLLTWLELPLYFVKRREYDRAALTFGGELGTMGLMALAASYNGAAVACFFLLPLIIVRFGMMSGNWGQHAFIAQDDPQNNYKSSTVCIRHDYNRQAYNDGYHTSHHLNPRRHWADHTNYFLSELDAFYSHQTIVFRDVDFMGVWIMLMLRQYNRMAELFVHCGPEHERPSKAQIIALIKSRVQPFSEAQIRKHYPNYDIAKSVADD